MLGFGVFGADDADEFALFELMLTDKPTRIAPRRPRFGTKAQRERGEPHGEGAVIEQFAHDACGEGDFAGGDEPAASLSIWAI